MLKDTIVGLLFVHYKVYKYYITCRNVYNSLIHNEQVKVRWVDEVNLYDLLNLSTTVVHMIPGLFSCLFFVTL